MMNDLLLGLRLAAEPCSVIPDVVRACGRDRGNDVFL